MTKNNKLRGMQKIAKQKSGSQKYKETTLLNYSIKIVHKTNQQNRKYKINMNKVQIKT